MSKENTIMPMTIHDVKITYQLSAQVHVVVEKASHACLSSLISAIHKPVEITYPLHERN